jgi:hypothetical protein
MEEIAGMFLDVEVERPKRQVDRSAVATDEEALRVERPRDRPVPVQPFRAVGPGKRSDQRSEVLGQGQLGQAHLVVDLKHAGPERHLDRAIDALVRDVVRPGRRYEPDQDAEQPDSGACKSVLGARNPGMAQLS